MSEIHFYHLQIHPLDRALPKLLEKSLERDWHVCLQMRTPEKCAALNELLWNVGEDGFLPHGTAEDGDVEFQPIYLTMGSESPNGAQIRFFVECAQIAPALAASAEPYERLVIMFDGNDENELNDARAQWKALKDTGVPMSYFQQTESGGWEKKA
jgi:DNA polymerase III subunit chi